MKHMQLDSLDPMALALLIYSGLVMKLILLMALSERVFKIFHLEFVNLIALGGASGGYTTGRKEIIEFLR